MFTILIIISAFTSVAEPPYPVSLSVTFSILVIFFTLFMIIQISRKHARKFCGWVASSPRFKDAKKRLGFVGFNTEERDGEPLELYENSNVQREIG